MDEVSGFRLALYGALIVFGAWGSWWAKIKALTVPRNAIVYQGLMALGTVLAIWGMIRGAGALGGMLAFAAILAGGMYLFTSFISALPTAPAGVAVGEKILDFTAVDSDGEAFSLSSLHGRPFLLKFYRGHW
jgi:hypothetical protein